MRFDDIEALLDPAPLQLETGWDRLPDGVLHAAARTDMRGCTGEMFEWWFRWRPDSQKYAWWHPGDHFSSEWGGRLEPDTHVGSEHIVNESLANIPATDLIVQFRDTTEFFDSGAYEVSRKSGAVSGAIVARIGMSHEPPRAPDGRVIGGRLLHICRDTPGGMVLRSHFFLGQDLPAAGFSPEQVAAEIPDIFAVNLVQHAYNEMTFLSRFLPSLFQAENRGTHQVALPW
jgi:hypothetical protein